MSEKDERERARRLGNHLGEIIARLVNEKAELTADRDLWRDRCKRLIGHYGSKRTWEYRADHEWHDIYRYAENGYDFAQQIQKEIDGE